MKTDDQSQYDNCQILALLVTTTNVHANSHIDDDAFYAIVTAHILNVKYDYRQDIVAYFCFPCHGVAVALRPGDVIMFNPRINHGLSSRCYLADNVITTGMYLKTATVGLNNNSVRPLQEFYLNTTQM